jgi:CRISPR/Cas system CMR-associated protein Cmr1 (group 7 of RAMP superfamily)
MSFSNWNFRAILIINYPESSLKSNWKYTFELIISISDFSQQIKFDTFYVVRFQRFDLSGRGATRAPAPPSAY